MPPYIRLKFLARSEGRDAWKDVKTGEVVYFPAGVNPNYNRPAPPKPAPLPSKTSPPAAPAKK